MKVLFHIPFYVDYQVSGGEMTAADLVRCCEEQGWEVRILVALIKDKSDTRLHETKDGITKHYEWCDIAITHLGSHGQAYNNAKYLKKPLICYLHNSFRYAIIQSRKEFNVIYNSKFVENELKPIYVNNRSELIHPILYSRFGQRSKEAKAILIINSNENKGGKQYCEIVKQMPNQKFIIIKGGYGEQIIPKGDNVEVIENCLDIEPYVKQSHTLLMLSRYESYGRTAVECILAGLKVVYSDTAIGLKEAVGGAGISVDRNNIPQVCRSLNKNVNIEYQQKVLKKQMLLDKEKFVKFVNKLTRK